MISGCFSYLKKILFFCSFAILFALWLYRRFCPSELITLSLLTYIKHYVEAYISCATVFVPHKELAFFLISPHFNLCMRSLIQHSSHWSNSDFCLIGTNLFWATGFCLILISLLLWATWVLCHPELTSFDQELTSSRNSPLLRATCFLSLPELTSSMSNLVFISSWAHLLYEQPFISSWAHLFWSGTHLLHEQPGFCLILSSPLIWATWLLSCPELTSFDQELTSSMSILVFYLILSSPLLSNVTFCLIRNAPLLSTVPLSPISLE